MTEVKVEERETVGAGQVIGADADRAGLPAVRVDSPDGGRRTWDAEEELTRTPVYDRVSQQMLGVLRAKWRGLKEEEIAQALEVAIAIGLNPWTGEIHAGKSRGRDGEEGRLLIMVGRDGLLRKAEEFPDYRGYDAAVVYEGDDFVQGDPDPEGKTLRARAGISHRRPGFPRADAQVLGAWCVAEREGRPLRTVISRLDEYMGHAKTPWGKTTSVMMEKVPISLAHRTLINLSGVYLEEEVAHVLEGADVTELPPARTEDLSWPETPEGERIRAAYLRLEEAAPGVWPAAKMEMIIPGLRTQEEQRALADQMEREAAIAEDRNKANEPVISETPAPEPAAEGAEPAGEPKAEEQDASSSDSASSNEEPQAEPDRPFKDVDSDKLRRDLETIDKQVEDADADSGDVDISLLRDEALAIEAELRIRGGEDPGQESLL